MDYLSVFAECLATAVFVAINTGAVAGLSSVAASTSWVTGASLAFGMSAAGLGYALSDTQAGQFNPVLTGALVATGQLGCVQAASHIVAQISGGFLGSAIVCALSTCTANTLAANAISPEVSVLGAFVGETLGAFAVSFVMLQSVSSESFSVRRSAPATVGMMVAAVHMFLIPYTSCGINPVRTLSPVLVSWSWTASSWVFYIAPVLGAALSVPCSHVLRKRTPIVTV